MSSADPRTDFDKKSETSETKITVSNLPDAPEKETKEKIEVPELTSENVTVRFEKDAKSERVTGITIDTPRLTLRAVSTNIIKKYPEITTETHSPFCDQAVMATFANGKARNVAYAKDRCEKWADRLEKKQSFFIGFAVFDKAKEKEEAFIGFVIPGHSDGTDNAEEGGADETNASEFACLFNTSSRGKGMGREAVTAAMHYYSALVVKKCLVNTNQAFQRVIGTLDLGNATWIKTLKGMHEVALCESFLHPVYKRLKMRFSILAESLLELFPCPQIENQISVTETSVAETMASVGLFAQPSPAPEEKAKDSQKQKPPTPTK